MLAKCAHKPEAEPFAEEILEIADDARNDWIERKRKDGASERVLNNERIKRSELRVNARKWLMDWSIRTSCQVDRRSPS